MADGITQSRTVRMMQEIREMPWEYLDEKLPEYRAEAMDIENQIRVRTAEAKTNGNKMDVGWLVRATNALKLKQLYISVMAERKKALKQEAASRASREYAQVFKQVAKDLLEEETYEMLTVETTGRINMMREEGR